MLKLSYNILYLGVMENFLVKFKLLIISVKLTFIGQWLMLIFVFEKN